MMMHACARGIFHNDAKSAAHTLTPLECLHPCRLAPLPPLHFNGERERSSSFSLSLSLARCYRAAALSFSAVCCCSSLPRPKTRSRTHDDACCTSNSATAQLFTPREREPVRTTYKGAIAIANIGATSCLSGLQFAMLKNRLLD